MNEVFQGGVSVASAGRWSVESGPWALECGSHWCPVRSLSVEPEHDASTEQREAGKASRASGF